MYLRIEALFKKRLFLNSDDPQIYMERTMTLMYVTLRGFVK